MLTSENIVVIGDIATWLTAFGTLGAFIVGFKQIYTERHERKKRETKDQVHIEQSQAKLISAWIDANHNVIVSNTSSHPIHHAVIELDSGMKIERHTIEPGKTTLKLSNPGTVPIIKNFTFIDSHSHIHWRKTPGSKLERAEQT